MALSRRTKPMNLDIRINKYEVRLHLYCRSCNWTLVCVMSSEVDSTRFEEGDVIRTVCDNCKEFTSHDIIGAYDVKPERTRLIFSDISEHAAKD